MESTLHWGIKRNTGSDTVKCHSRISFLLIDSKPPPSVFSRIDIRKQFQTKMSTPGSEPLNQAAKQISDTLYQKFFRTILLSPQRVSYGINDPPGSIKGLPEITLKNAISVLPFLILLLTTKSFPSVIAWIKLRDIHRVKRKIFSQFKKQNDTKIAS